MKLDPTDTFRSKIRNFVQVEAHYWPSETKGIRVLVMKDGNIGIITAVKMLSRLKEHVDRVSSTIARLQSPYDGDLF